MDSPRIYLTRQQSNLNWHIITCENSPWIGLAPCQGAQYQFLGVGFPVQGCGFKAIWTKLIKIKYSKMERSLNMRVFQKLNHILLRNCHGFPWFFSADLSNKSSLGIWPKPSSPWTKALGWWSFTSDSLSKTVSPPWTRTLFGALEKNTGDFRQSQ